MNFWFEAINEFIFSINMEDLSELENKLTTRYNFLNQQLNQPGQKSKEIIECNENFIALLKNYYCPLLANISNGVHILVLYQKLL